MRFEGIRTAVLSLGLVVGVLGATVASTPASAAVDAKKTAVVVIDMQGGFYDRGHVRGTPGLEALVAKQQELLNWAVAQDVPVLIFEYKNFQATNSRLTTIVAGHTYQIVEKVTDGAFNSPTSRTPAMDILKRWNVDTLIVAGINGGACVVSTVRGALKEGFAVVTSAEIVGDLNRNPPVYPNATWFGMIPANPKFTIAPDLATILN